MKRAVLLSLLVSPILYAVADEFVNGQAADVVLGQKDFISDMNPNLPSRIRSPLGVERDPVTGKVFVASAFDHRILRYSSASAARNGSDPEAVFGQTNFTSTDAGTTRTTFDFPSGLHLDFRGRLWVAERGNHRVLCFVGAVTRENGAEADFVFGQLNFTNGTSASGASRMFDPSGVWVDFDDNLWVADSGNNRVLRFDDISTRSSGASADVVLGQPDFATVSQSTTVSKMARPRDLAVDSEGSLWVTDLMNNRVLRFDNAAAKSNGDPADGVLGQLDFDTATPELSQTGMNFPFFLTIGTSGVLWVTDYNNRRALGFAGAAGLPDGAPATTVLGQPDFVSANTTIDARTFVQPAGISFGPGGSLFVADVSSDRVLRFSPIPTPAAATNTALLALKARLLATGKKLKKKAKAAKKKGKAAKAKKLTAKAKKLIKRARSI